MTVPGTRTTRAAETGYLPPRKAWFLVAVIFLAWTAGQIDRQAIIMLVEPMKRDLHFTDEQMGIILGFAFSLTYSVSAIFMAYLGDRTGRKRVLASGLAAWSLFTAACAFASSFPLMLLARLGVGAGESVIQPLALPMVASAFPPEKRSFPLVICTMGATVGLVITPVLIGTILHATEGMVLGPYPVVGEVRGWQLAFLIAGIIGLAVLPLLALVTEPFNATGGRNAASIRQSFSHFANNPRLYRAAILTTPLFSIAFYGCFAWMPSYLSRNFGMEPREIGIAISAAWLPAVIVPSLLAGGLGNWAARQPDVRANFRVLLWLLPLAALFIVLTPLMPTKFGCIVCFAALTCTSSTVLGYSTINIQQSIMPRYRSQATAVYTACLSLIGSGLGPIVVGWLATRVIPDNSLGGAIIATAILTLPIALLNLLVAVSKPIEERETGQVSPAEAANVRLSSAPIPATARFRPAADDRPD